MNATNGNFYTFKLGFWALKSPQSAIVDSWDLFILIHLIQSQLSEVLDVSTVFLFEIFIQKVWLIGSHDLYIWWGSHFAVGFQFQLAVNDFHS